MRYLAFIFVTALLATLSPPAVASQASNSSINVIAQNAGPTPFINKLTVTVSNLRALNRVRFTIRPKPGSVTRPLSAVYPKGYLAGRGFVNPGAKEIIVPVFGLYDGYDNTVQLTYFFNDGSYKTATTIISTTPYDDECDLNTPVIRQARTSSTALSYDYFLAASSCSLQSPTVMDTDGSVRWVGTAGIRKHYTAFYHNGIYTTQGTRLLRMELDGEVRVIADYAPQNVVGFHHNMDKGKQGLILDVDTKYYVESVHLEVHPFTGEVFKKWNLADIVREAMKQGGDDPSGFVRMAKGNYSFTAHEDWTHNNAVAYRPSDNTIIISSRENYVIAIDYDTGEIKWILGDTSKAWYQNYPSLRKFALALAPGSIAPVGQHSVSITKDDKLLLMDNGQRSAHHTPAGPNRSYCAPRKYDLDLETRVATEVWNFTNDQSVDSPFRSSVYEDAASNYLVTYSVAVNPDGSKRAQILGLDASGQKVFDYSYPTETCCDEAYRAIPVHWEKLRFFAPVKAPMAAAVNGDSAEALAN